MARFLIPLVLSASVASVAVAQESPSETPDSATPEIFAERDMTPSRVARIAQALDPEAELGLNGVQLTIADVPVLIVMDPVADRMRAMVPIRDASEMSAEELARVMQANFDTALDARYAIARGRLWAVFIHPLSPLKRDQLISGIGQTVNIALTYGSAYSGGALSFGGGDSGSLLLEELQKRGQEL
ncbi:MAG: hypothetical protein AAFR53_03545 [Pseudomonadota bacterium]